MKSYHLFVFTLLLVLLSGCGGNSSKKSSDEIQNIVDKMIEASKNDDFETQQILGDKMFFMIKEEHNCRAEIWLSFHYFSLCCYNGGSQEDVKMKMELYTIKYLGVGTLWQTVKDMDAIWFSNIERSAELIERAYDDSPALTNKLIEEEYDFDAFQTFARIVLRKR